MQIETEYQLPTQWAEYLRDRAVPPDVAKARGYKYVRAGKPLDGDFASAWNFPRAMSGLLIPLHGLLNPEGGDVQLRLEHPEKHPDAGGKPKRFSTPKGQSNVLVTSPLTRAALSEERQVIHIAEGVTRVDALAAYGIPAVGLLGINNWRTGSPTQPLADFEKLAIQGNKFVIEPDGDVRTNPKVNRAVARLRNYLIGRQAASVSVLALPGEGGLDDWLASEKFLDRDAVLHAILELCTDQMVPVMAAPPTGDAFDINDAGPWSCTPAADVRRLLEFAPEKFCVVQGAAGRPWRLLVVQEGGRWSSAKDDAAVGEMHMRAALAWQRQVSESVMRGKLDSEQAQACTRWAITSAKPTGVRDLLAMVGQTYRFMKASGICPSLLTVCRDEDIDADRQVIGAPNGVISLDSGQLMPSEAARATFTTRYIPDPFDPLAQHPYVEELLAHLVKTDRDYLLQAIGYALRGNAARRVYGLVGELGGGKSTLLSALVGSLGDVALHGYAMGVAIDAFLSSRWSGGAQAHHGNLFGMQDARIAVTEEPPNGASLNISLLKDLSGGRPQRFRDVGEKAAASRTVRATLFMALNYGQEDLLDTSDDAFADRARLLNYPPLPAKEIDPERITTFSSVPEVRQAAAALFIAWAAKTTTRPDDPLSVTKYSEQRRRDSIGAVGEYIEKSLKVTDRDADRVSLDSFIEAVAAACGGKDDKGLIEGYNRKDILGLARALVKKLPRAKKRAGQLVWAGVAHSPSPADEDDVPEENAELLPAGRKCPRCARRRDVGEVDKFGQCLDEESCDRAFSQKGPPSGAETGDTEQGGFDGMPSTGQPLAIIAARLEDYDSRAMPNATRHPHILLPHEWAMLGTLRGLDAALRENPALLPAKIADHFGGMGFVLNGYASWLRKTPEGYGTNEEIAAAHAARDWATALLHMRQAYADAVRNPDLLARVVAVVLQQSPATQPALMTATEAALPLPGMPSELPASH